MKIGIVEYGGSLAKIFQEEVGRRLEDASFQAKPAFDLLDVLAYARRLVDSDQLVIIAQIDPAAKEQNAAFYQGLAALEVETGKNIFKLVYTSEEDGEALVREFAETFINSLCFPEKLIKPTERGEEGLGFEL